MKVQELLDAIETKGTDVRNPQAVLDATRYVAEKTAEGSKYVRRVLTKEQQARLVATVLSMYSSASLASGDINAFKFTLKEPEVLGEVLAVGIALGVMLSIDNEWR